MATYLNEERTENDIRKMMGKRIKDLRIKKGWTQSDLAEKLGYKDNKSVISRYEKGLVFPKTEILIRLADELECDINYLLKADKGKTPAISTLIRLTGLTDDSIGYLIERRKSETEFELEIINGLLEYDRLQELLAAIEGYRTNRDRVDPTSRKPTYHAMLVEEYTKYRVQPSYRALFVAKMAKAIGVDKELIKKIEQEQVNYESIEMHRTIDTTGLTSAEKKMVKEFYDYEEKLFREHELTARELQIHRLFMNYLELY